MEGAVGSVAVVVFDTSSSWLEGSAAALSAALEAVRSFVVAHLLQCADSRVALVSACGAGGGVLLREPLRESERSSSADTAERIVQLIKQDMAKHTTNSNTNSAALHCALSAALCHLHRLRSSLPHLTQQRVWLVSRSPDDPSAYVPLMNCIFSAQKDDVLLDSLLCGPSSRYLSHAARATGGLCLRCPTDALLERSATALALGYFAVPPAARAAFETPPLKPHDPCASCFCHAKRVEVAHVCSVCLSVFCEFIPVCTTCNSKFVLPALPDPK